MDGEQLYRIATVFGVFRIPLGFILRAFWRDEWERSSADFVQVQVLEEFRQPAGLSDALVPPLGGEVPKANQLNRATWHLQMRSRGIDHFEQVTIRRIADFGKGLQRAQQLRSARYVLDDPSHLGSALGGRQFFVQDREVDARVSSQGKAEEGDIVGCRDRAMQPRHNVSQCIAFEDIGILYFKRN